EIHHTKNGVPQNPSDFLNSLLLEVFLMRTIMRALTFLLTGSLTGSVPKTASSLVSAANNADNADNADNAGDLTGRDNTGQGAP
ncbi:hypothetical protein, partial [Paenibacillus thiaminolyticus]|uniref:hypothetical protein n=1 Tax=Paenibacillus thiaminolyticus TaxID=49283 RepID=UPI001C3FB8A7